MRIRAGTVVLATAALVAISLGVACSTAATTAATWTVRPGGAVIGVAVPPKAKLRDTTTGSTLVCGTVMSGTFRRGSGLAGTGIAKIVAAGFDCATPPKWPSLTSRGLPWHLNLVSYDARTGVSHGTISGLQFSFSDHGCRALINGTSGPAANGVVAVTFANKTSKSKKASLLTILPGDGTLHWYHVHGCGHMAANGDPATLSAAYIIGRQTITSP